jgi:hypothetical protein
MFSILWRLTAGVPFAEIIAQKSDEIRSIRKEYACQSVGHCGGFATHICSHWAWAIPLPEKLNLEFPMKSGHGVKLYSVRSYSAGDTYPREECRRLVL